MLAGTIGLVVIKWRAADWVGLKRSAVPKAQRGRERGGVSVAKGHGGCRLRGWRTHVRPPRRSNDVPERIWSLSRPYWVCLVPFRLIPLGHLPAPEARGPLPRAPARNPHPRTAHLAPNRLRVTQPTSTSSTAFSSPSSTLFRFRLCLFRPGRPDPPVPNAVAEAALAPLAGLMAEAGPERGRVAPGGELWPVLFVNEAVCLDVGIGEGGVCRVEGEEVEGSGAGEG